MVASTVVFFQRGMFVKTFFQKCFGIYHTDHFECYISKFLIIKILCNLSIESFFILLKKMSFQNCKSYFMKALSFRRSKIPKGPWRIPQYKIHARRILYIFGTSSFFDNILKLSDTEMFHINIGNSCGQPSNSEEVFLIRG